MKDDSDVRAARKASLKAFLLKWHLPLLLVFALVVGFFAPRPGESANDADLRGICFSEEICVYDSAGSFLVAVIFLISGMKLKTEEIKSAMRARKAALFGIVSILFLTPLAAFVVVLIDFGVDEFAIGLALFFSMPTTLSSGAVLVAQGQGSFALAIMLTVFSNVIGIFTAPLFVAASLEIFEARDGVVVEDVSITVDPVPVIVKLIFTILFPLLFGKFLRRYERVRKFAARYKTELKVLSSVLLAIIPWMKVSSSSESFGVVDGPSIAYTWLVGIAVHLIYLAFNFVVCDWILHLVIEETIAVVILASQKTLPVALTILEFLPEEVVGAPGLIAIPVILAHLMQILIDSFVSAKFSAIVDRQNQKVDQI